MSSRKVIRNSVDFLLTIIKYLYLIKIETKYRTDFKRQIILIYY